MHMATLEQETHVLRFGMDMKRVTWFNFRIDFSASILFALYNVVVNQFYTPMAIRHGISNVEVGLLTAAPAIGSLLSPLWAAMMGRRSPMPFIFWPNLLARLSICVVGLWLSPLMFVAVALFVNFLGAIQAPAYPALMPRIYPGRLRGRLMGYVRVAQCLFLVPLALIVGAWLHVDGDMWPLICASALGVASLILFTAVRQVEPQPPHAAEDLHHTPGFAAHIKGQWRLVKTTAGLGAFLVATSLTGFGNLVGAPLFQIYQIHVLNLNNFQIGETRMAYYALLLIAYFALGWVIDKVSPRHALLWGMAAYAMMPILYAAFGSFGAVLAASGFQGIGDAAWDIGLMAYVFQMAPGKEASVFGLHLLLFGVRGTIAPLLSTAAAAVVPLPVLLVGATLFCLAGLIVLAVFRPHARPGGDDLLIASHSPPR